MHTFLSGRFRFAHKSRHLTHSGFYIYRQEFLIETLAEDIENALTQISGTQIEYFGTIAMKSKGDLRIYQCNPLESRQNIVQLCRIGLQELPSRGYIIKDIADREDASHSTGAWFLSLIHILTWLVATLLTRLITTLLIIIVVTRTIAPLLRTRLIASLLTWLVATTVAVTITTTALIAAALWTLAAACTLQASTETFRTETAFAVTATSVAAVCAM